MQKLIWVFVILILFACTPAETMVSTATKVSSSTLMPSTATSIYAPMATSAPSTVTERCAKMLSAFPEDSVPLETLVIDPSGNLLSLLNFRQNTQHTISVNHYAVSTSPNGKWLSYVTDSSSDDQYELIVESVDGQKQTQVILDSDWIVWSWLHWLNNKQLWFLVRNKEGANPPTLLLNPFTGEKQILLADYPNFNPSYIGPGLPLFYNGVSNVAYDRSLRFVVYPLATDDSYTALLDRETGQTVVKIHTGGLYGPLPLWLPDGRAVLVSAVPYTNGLQEWWMMDIDGEISQLTHIGNIASQYEFGEVASLSPDGHYLAFGISYREPDRYGPTELFIINLQTLEATNTCMTFNYFPVWSPDSRYLAIQHWDDNQKQNSVLVLDFESGWAVTVFTDDKETNYQTAPRGWLDSGE